MVLHDKATPSSVRTRLRWQLRCARVAVNPESAPARRPDAAPTSKQRSPGDVWHLLPGAAPGKPRIRLRTLRGPACV